MDDGRKATLKRMVVLMTDPIRKPKRGWVWTLMPEYVFSVPLLLPVALRAAGSAGRQYRFRNHTTKHNYERRSITHMGFEPAKVIDASFEIVRQIPALMDSVASMKAVQLTEGERNAFAQAAVVARWEETEKAPVRAEKLLIPMRQQDAAPNLWNTLNTVQEHLMKGGQRDYGKRTPDGKRMPKSRAVKGIDGGVGLNKALWTLAQEMRKLKA